MLHLHHKAHRSIGVALASLLLLAGSAACSGADSPSETEPSFDYGLAEMRETAEGTWTGAFERTGAPATTMTLVLAYSPPKAQPACGNRALGQPLCIDMSSMGVTGTLLTADGAYDDAVVTGSFNVMGTKLTNGDLELALPDGLRMYANYNGGKFENGTLNDSKGSAGTFTMARK